MTNKPTLAVGLDAGSAHTRCVICAVEDAGLRFLGSADVESRGWTRGRLADQSALAASLRRAVQSAELEAGVPTDGAVVGVGGTGIEGGNARGVYEFGRPRQIDLDDLGYAVERATRLRLDDSRMLLQVCPQDFTLDGRAGFRNPRGAACARLEANVHVITAPAQEHDCLVAAVHEAHLAVEETVFEPVAAAYAAVTEEDRSRGVALLDIGCHSTEIAVYDGEALAGAVTVPIGGDHFTRDVAYCLTVSYEDAERLKVQYGCAILGLTADSTLIEVPSPEGRAPREATRRQLNEILEARAEELFEHARREIARVGMERSLLEGLVLTGGGALLNGMCDMAERVLNCPARNGLPIGIASWPDRLDCPSWTTAAGLAMYSARLKFRKEVKKKAPGFLGMVLR